MHTGMAREGCPVHEWDTLRGRAWQGQRRGRSVLWAVAGMAGAAATAPLRRESALAQAGPSSDADALFKAGEFEQAGRRLNRKRDGGSRFEKH